MRNNLAFKFIAVILCAASLVGAVGSIAGVIVLTEGDLYNKTVPQVRQERVRQDAELYSHMLANLYASSQLGGCPEDMVTDAIGSTYWMESQYPDYGYVITDTQGNLLSSYNEEAQASSTPFTYSASGQYMHLVSVESDAQIQAREAQEQVQQRTQDTGTSDSIPQEGVLIDHVLFFSEEGLPLYEASGSIHGEAISIYYNPDGSSYSYSHRMDYIGFLTPNDDNQFTYHSFLTDPGMEFSSEVGEYYFANSLEGFTLSDHGENLGILSISFDSEKIRFFSTLPAAPAVEEILLDEKLPGWTLETVPGAEDQVTVIAPDGTAIEVTLPQPTEPEQTVPEATQETVMETTEFIPETSAETIPSSASAVPETSSPVEETVFPPVTEATAATEAPAPTQAPTQPPETIPEETEPAETLPSVINGKPLEDYQINTLRYHDSQTGQRMTAKYVYVPMPELAVTLYLNENTMRDNTWYDLLTLIRQVRSYLLPAIGICLLVFAVFAVYLCTAAGRKPKCEEVRPSGLNRLPLDLYFCCACFAIACIAAVSVEGTESLLRRDFYVGCGFAVGAAFLAALLFVAFCFALAAQVKAPGGFWWRNTLLGHCVRLFARFAVWLENFLASKGFPFLGRLLKNTWRFTCTAVVWSYRLFERASLWLIDRTGRLLRKTGRKLHRFLSLLPVTWQWMLAGLTMVFFLFITVAGRYDAGMILSILFALALVLYGAHCFGTLQESAKKMSRGDLDTKVDDRLMIGSFKEFAGDLNDLADVAVIAAQKQLKSERMKTELITNVSHDIKTPLTSIINYVDLLQKPHTPEDEQQYLEVLDRQSQRLKKLIDDLMDMSKANTGNMQVDITRLDAVESVTQALGEFADKLEKAHLTPVFRHDDTQVPMMADGRLVWRVLSNLLSNAVKYAMPGTRLYVDLMKLEGKAVISLKNISREELNIDADELMERFVRGDDSRNTEGSGLGLNIARSLMELQKGQLQLLVDGDLFKVTLIFPGE